MASKTTGKSGDYVDMTDEDIVDASREAKDPKTWQALMDELARRLPTRWNEESLRAWTEFYKRERGDRPEFDKNRGSFKKYMRMKVYRMRQRLYGEEGGKTSSGESISTLSRHADPPDRDLSPEDVFVAAEESLVLIKAIGKLLTPLEREVAFRAWIGLKAHNTIAREVGISRATVARHLYKAEGKAMGYVTRTYFPDGLVFLTGSEEDVFLKRVEGMAPTDIAQSLGLDRRKMQALLKGAIRKIGDRL